MCTAIILGSKEDFHAQHMLKACKRRNVNAFRLDTSDYPSNTTISYFPEQQDGTIESEQMSLKFSEIDSVFWSSISPSTSHSSNPLQDQIATNDSTSMIYTLMLTSTIKWCNSWHDFHFHKAKPKQLALAAKTGATIPNTYTGNNPIQLAEFAQSQEKSIYKPVYGGAYCALVTPQLLDKTHLSSVLKVSPVTIQSFVPGANIRTFVINDRTFSGRIDSDSVDFREDEQHIVKRHTLPDEVQSLAIKIRDAFKMQWTAIDWRLTPDGKYYFLEANPSPMFIHFEQQTGFPITEELITMLST
ncbi:hypothetical protein OE749_07615 [Aestuariibacter sp. AA17]|uniref:ATP-grasp domain-containing protein n=1 Tax=Fluctibacter corallii TaxID=2984329 RepID=A0ABT3A7B5_9ALTE|nr:hypothetical protein [Aestuariibacter sp. AA17]MCV2884558.1 hypothetical protein [Aestuariibacter sp. AA17]